MRHMRSFLAGRDMDDAIFREIWLEKLPVPMQQVLAMLDSKTPLEKLANHAERIKECYPIGASCSNIQQPPPSKASPIRALTLIQKAQHYESTTLPIRKKHHAVAQPDERPHQPVLPEHPPTLIAPITMTYETLCASFALRRATCALLLTVFNRLENSHTHIVGLNPVGGVHNHYVGLIALMARKPEIKRQRQPVMATTAAGPSRPSRLFYINDKSSSLRFLVDTGAEVSVIPPLRRHRLKPSQFSLQAANSTTISTYGQRSLTLDLDLRRRFQWVFIEADVKSPIIGADFLSSFGLTVDVRHRRLTDTTTQLFTIGTISSERSVGIHLTIPSSPFADILKD
ncbi:hypothetical protein SprV_0301069100 [Sparganum proliferum]